MSRQGWFARLRAGLARTSSALRERLGAIVGRRRLDEELLEEIEEALILADMGVETAAGLVEGLRRKRLGREVSDEEVRRLLAADIAALLAPVAEPFPLRRDARPQVVLVVGVNGTGKTTTIGKLAAWMKGQGLSVMMAACDTFRAAATEQLEIWAQRTGCPLVRGRPGADAAGLAYEALGRARREGAEVLLVDTAGRLHNRTELMAELQKIVRVLGKLDPSAPHDVLLVLDATTGQNAHNQLEIFRSMVPVSGLVITKLDGTAKGGIVVALARRFAVPVHFVGVGEGVEDLRPFEPEAFARALLGLEDGEAAS